MVVSYSFADARLYPPRLCDKVATSHCGVEVDMKQRFRDPFIAALVLSLLGSRAVYAQALDPSYLVGMPAPARIIAEIKGKDAEDTGERQMGAFMALIKMMDDMAWGIGHRYVNDADTRRLTPDERRIRLACQT